MYFPYVSPFPFLLSLILLPRRSRDTNRRFILRSGLRDLRASEIPGYRRGQNTQVPENTRPGTPTLFTRGRREPRTRGRAPRRYSPSYTILTTPRSALHSLFVYNARTPIRACVNMCRRVTRLLLSTITTNWNFNRTEFHHDTSQASSRRNCAG